ncbi:alpha/beta fold hydrolase [Microbacterium aurugineum]
MTLILRRAIAVLGAYAAVALVIETIVRRTAKPPPGTDIFTATNGSRLSWTRVAGGAEDADLPVLVLGGDIGFASEAWNGVARAAQVAGRDVLLYDRVGLGSSGPRALRGSPNSRRRSGTAGQELAELIDAVVPGRPVVLVGSGYGALVASDAISFGVNCSGLILVDPSLPGDWLRFARHLFTRLQDRRIETAITFATLKLGGGWLRVPPPMSAALDMPVRRLIRATDRSSATWVALLHEIEENLGARHTAELVVSSVPRTTIIASKRLRATSPYLCQHWQDVTARYGGIYHAPEWLNVFDRPPVGSVAERLVSLVSASVEMRHRA